MKYVLLLLLAVVGCAPGPVRPPMVPPPPVVTPPPTFEKTFGEIQLGVPSALDIAYKNMELVIDPAPGLQTAGGGPVRPEYIDYLLLTGTGADRFDPALKKQLRLNQKIIAPPDTITSLQGQGFGLAKGLGNGERLMLKKNDSFLFVVGVTPHCYLLEFDNGRNIFISGETPESDSLREFVYGLRDDGKEIHLAFFERGQRTENELAQTIALLQPRVAILTRLDGNRGLDETLFRAELQNQLFNGELYIPRPAEKIPF